MLAARCVLTGIDAIEKGMDAQNKARMRNLRVAGNQARSILRTAIRDAAPIHSGRTRRSVGGDVWLVGTQVHVDVGPEVRRGGSMAHFSEFGTAPRTTLTGANRGQTRAQNWAGTAVDAVDDQIVDLIGNSVEVW